MLHVHNTPYYKYYTFPQSQSCINNALNTINKYTRILHMYRWAAHGSHDNLKPPLAVYMLMSLVKQIQTSYSDLVLQKITESKPKQSPPLTLVLSSGINSIYFKLNKCAVMWLNVLFTNIYWTEHKYSVTFIYI